MKFTNRREFLRRSLLLAGSASIMTTLGRFQIASALAADAKPADDYRALVCVFLYGGNDSFNMLIPNDPSGYQTYSDTRRSFAVAAESLLPLSGTDFALHPATPEIQSLFSSGEVALVANTGPLIVPTTRAQYLAQSVPLPPHLFSHSDQQNHWMAVNPGSTENSGWAGRVAELMDSNWNISPLAMNISTTGSNILQISPTAAPYVLGDEGANELLSTWDETLDANLKASFSSLMTQSASAKNLLVQEYANRHTRAMELARTVNAALAAGPAITTNFDENNGLAKQLKLVLRMMSVQQELGASRQVFFVAGGGWDTHDAQLSTHPNLLSGLSQALAQFQSGLNELGMEQQVTTFTESEFGRTLTSNGDGTDHGWGGNQIVMGGAVNGGAIYGNYPILAVDGPDDADFGRIIPTTAVETLSAELAGWLGLPQSEMATVFPNLHQFDNGGLGILSNKNARRHPV